MLLFDLALSPTCVKDVEALPGGHVIISVRAIELSDRQCVGAFLMEQPCPTQVVTRGIMHAAYELPGLIAWYGSAPKGLLTYSHRNNELEVVTLHSEVGNVGLGSGLLMEARKRACNLRCRRMWLTTTNDNEPAIRFYQNRGMRLAAIHRSAIAESRKLKPQIAYFGAGGRPIEDEIEFEELFTEPH